MWNEDKIRPAADSSEDLKLDYLNVIEQETTEGRVMGGNYRKGAPSTNWEVTAGRSE